MKKFAIAFIIFASSLTAQVQLGKNVQIGASSATGTVTEVDTDTTSGISGGPITTTGTVACEQSTASQFGCVKPDGTTITVTGGVLSATGGGGSGVQYNPTTTSYILASVSSTHDDGDANSRSLGVPTSVTCTGTSPSTCTVVFGSAHGLSVGDAIDMHLLSGWPVGGGALSSQGAQFGSFQVATVPLTTSLTFTTPTNLGGYTCGPCTGTTYDASLWAIWQFAKQPYIYGHGTVYGLETTAAALDTNFTSLTSGITGTPTYLINQTGQNDFAGGTSVASLETTTQSIWAKAHTAGMIVVQTTMVPVQYGVVGVGIKPGQFNYWLWQQSQGLTATTKASGQYVDRYSDTATGLLKSGGIGSLPSFTVNRTFAQVLNEAFGVQSGFPTAPPTQFSYSATGLGDDQPAELNLATKHFYDENYNLWMDWVQGPAAMIQLWQTGLTAGNSYFSDTVGRDSGNNNCFYRSFHYTGAGSTSNYLAFGPCGGSDGLRLLGTGALQLPALGASSGTQPLVVDTAGNVSVGTGVTGPASATADDVATFNGTTGQIIKDSGIASSNIVTAVTPSSPITASITGHTLSVACPTCGTATGGTNVSQNSGAAETNLPITGFMPQPCADTSGSGTAQSCTVANTFVPQANNCVVYTTTTTNSGTGLTVNVNSLGAKSVAIPGASGWTTTLTASIIPANKPLNMCYDGTNWNVQQTGTVSASGGSGAWTNISGTITPTNMTCTSTACTASAASTITFASIPSTGTHIVIEMNYAASSGAALHCQLNGDTASTSYAYQGAEFNTLGTTQLAAVSQTFIFCGAGTVLATAGTIKIPFYTVTTRPRVLLLEDAGFASQSSNTSNFNDILGGLWNNTSSAVNSIKIFPASGTITGSFSIYLVN